MTIFSVDMNEKFTKQEHLFMAKAILLAKKVKGKTSPNPAVGAVVVKRNKVVGVGATLSAGKDHAEIVALKKAKSLAKNSILFVTLEPCCHQGKTGPCTQLIINAGIKEVICSIKDPNPLVNGKGFKALKRAGIKVRVGLLNKESELINKDFIKWARSGKPYVTLKLALTWDGRIADKQGQSNWITGPLFKKWVMEQRSQHDAILIGAGTVRKDNPLLTARGSSLKNPLRVVIDPKLSISTASQLYKSSNRVATMILYSNKNSRLLKRKNPRGLVMVYCKPSKNGFAIRGILKILGQAGILSVFVEGGSHLASLFIKKRIQRKQLN